MDAHIGDKYRINTKQLSFIFNYLTESQFQNIGPKFRDGAVMLDHLSSLDEIPRGCYEDTGKGSYRLARNKDGSFFQYTLGPQSFKRFLHPPRRKLWGAKKNENGFTIETGDPVPQKMAFWGVRSCEISAIEILDRIFLKEDYVNKWYQKAREELFIIAVGCTRPASNCFCVAANTGPQPKSNFDISLIESYGEDHYFILEIGSDKGAHLVDDLNLKKAKTGDIDQCNAMIASATDQMNKPFDSAAAAVLLKNNPEHPQWDDVATRCLACANCTMVCPTCFCTATEDITDLSGDHTERWLRWDPCFNGGFSYIHGGPIQRSIKSRYRQWMTHKLSRWYDQFGTSGCVGCGRCITWCPVGIDLTEELLAMKEEKAEIEVPVS